METTDARSPNDQPAPTCKRCNEAAATIKMRAETACRPCFAHFIAGKIVKRMEVLNRETKLPTSETRTMLLGLSFGASSSAMVYVLHQNSRRHEIKKRRGGVIEYIVAHIDTSLSPAPSESEALIEKYKTRFSPFPTSVIPLRNILQLQNTVDWSGLPTLNPDLASEPDKQLEDMFSRLPSTTSRADILRIFVRHLLIGEAVRRQCSTLLLGHTTTALAETTLSEAAKGRGFAVPWLVADGNIPVSSALAEKEEKYAVSEAQTRTFMPIYYPMREVFRKEVILYNKSITPPLTDLVPDDPSGAGGKGAVVSHKSLSIEEVMGRYFEEVEENYPSIVANVVRTTAKLNRLGMDDGGEGNECGLCGLGLDETGDERWRGEIGDEEANIETSRPLCYGCERSLRG
ncbi:hypothetical protein MKZ38_010752 [Zalerion maritima]|uniref:Cytoplasmic tRNA 2-thiolation protein 2 n=1 Tax=Zalerion maritima TaxID=339359 RepID=A0AAD5RY13_9PEZI|nr:hypothetical protein MKZ38_010752 [Zalerion maritima]